MKAFSTIAWLLGILAPSLILAADPPADLPDELAPLNRLVGKWQKEFEVTTVGQTPEKVKKSGTHTSEWILKNRHLRETGQDSDGTEYLVVTTYDPQGKQLRGTFYQSTGFSSTLIGSFDAATSTFTWKDSAGGNFVAKNQFLDADTYKMHYVAKGPDGAIVFEIQGTAKRVKER